MRPEEFDSSFLVANAESDSNQGAGDGRVSDRCLLATRCPQKADKSGTPATGSAGVPAGIGLRGTCAMTMRIRPASSSSIDRGMGVQQRAFRE